MHTDYIKLSTVTRHGGHLIVWHLTTTETRDGEVYLPCHGLGFSVLKPKLWLFHSFWWLSLGSRRCIVIDENLKA